VKHGGSGCKLDECVVGGLLDERVDLLGPQVVQLVDEDMTIGALTKKKGKGKGGKNKARATARS